MHNMLLKLQNNLEPFKTGCLGSGTRKISKITSLFIFEFMMLYFDLAINEWLKIKLRLLSKKHEPKREKRLGFTVWQVSLQ